MVAAEDHPLEARPPVLWLLHGERDKVLNLGDLRGLFHDHVVVVEAQRGDLSPLDRGVRRGHGDDPRFVGQQIVGLVLVAPQNLKRQDVCQLGKDLGYVLVASVGDVQNGLAVRVCREKGLRSVREIRVEGECLNNLLGAYTVSLDCVVEPGPCRFDVDRVEVAGRLGRVPVGSRSTDTGSKPVHLEEKALPVLEERLDPAMLAETPFGF